MPLHWFCTRGSLPCLVRLHSPASWELQQTPAVATQGQTWHSYQGHEPRVVISQHSCSIGWHPWPLVWLSVQQLMTQSDQGSKSYGNAPCCLQRWHLQALVRPARPGDSDVNFSAGAAVQKLASGTALLNMCASPIKRLQVRRLHKAMRQARAATSMSERGHPLSVSPEGRAGPASVGCNPLTQADDYTKI